jgi:hypothetical protein
VVQVHTEQIGPRLKFALILTLLVSSVLVNQSSLLAAREQKDNATFAAQGEVIYVPELRQMRLMTLGYSQAAADITWLRTLEYFADHFRSDRRYPWLEVFLEQIVALDPGFTKVYHWAGANVLYGRRFTNENVERSNHFYELALKQNPDDFEAAYRLGLNHYIELSSKDKDVARTYRERGLAYFEQAANTPGAPDRVRRLIAAVSSKLGKHQLSLQYLVDMYMQTSDAEQKEVLRLRIIALKKTLGTSEIADEALQFTRKWKAMFPYVPPSMYAILGEPDENGTMDVYWAELLPDVAISESQNKTKTGFKK